MEQTKKKSKPKFKEFAALAYYTGSKMGATAFDSKYDKYRRYSSFVWLALGLLFMIVDWMEMVLISFGVLHLHLLFNQLWWKLLNIEYNFMEKEELEDGSKLN